MKQIYEMPQMTIVEMELQSGLMQDPSDPSGTGAGFEGGGSIG